MNIFLHGLHACTKDNLCPHDTNLIINIGNDTNKYYGTYSTYEFDSYSNNKEIYVSDYNGIVNKIGFDKDHLDCCLYTNYLSSQTRLYFGQNIKNKNKSYR